ncbi:MAG: methyltransferase domain-containing protein, partial [Gammaproteobacteria bacterium]|nr:methyltransferase domain-containing protein [Gammaproteobacteria bacterium]
AGLVYEFARQTTTPLHADPLAVHRKMAAATPRGAFRRILDWGCGTGASTVPFARLYPQAELHGIDLAAPCLRLAAARAAGQGLRVHWSQQAMEQTNFPDACFDLVHSTFLLHELPRSALRQAVAEAYRILAPGGWFVNLDFHSPPGGIWGQFIHYGHARRNNEAFMRAFCTTDFAGLLAASGFGAIEMRPFDDGTGLLAADAIPSRWRFPWQLFLARKPA